MGVEKGMEKGMGGAMWRRWSDMKSIAVGNGRRLKYLSYEGNASVGERLL